MILKFEEMIDILMANAEWDKDDTTPAQAFSIRFQEGNPPKLAAVKGYDTTDMRTVHLYFDEDGSVFYLAIG